MAAIAVIRPHSNIMTLGQSINNITTGNTTTMLYHSQHNQHASAQASTIVMRPLHASNHSAAPAPKCIKPKINSGPYPHLQQLNSARHQPYATLQPQTVSVQRRNARERNRVKQVNNGFSTLRQHIPTDVVAALSSGGRGASKKLSKVDTLKVAVEYIRRLEDLLDEVVNDENASSASSSSSNSSANYYAGHASPTPSYCSSSVESSSASSTSSSSASGHTHSTSGPAMYKYETEEPTAYDPDDEELLDCITWWQQQ